MNDNVCITFIVVFFALFFASCGYHIGVISGQNTMQKQVVENNAGYTTALRVGSLCGVRI